MAAELDPESLELLRVSSPEPGDEAIVEDDLALFSISRRRSLSATSVDLASKLFISCDTGDIAAVRGLLNHQENESFINIRSIENNETPLYRAAKRGHYEIVQVLLQHKANVNSLNGRHDHDTPLVVASEHGHTEIVELLLQHKASVVVNMTSEERELLYSNFDPRGSPVIEYGPEVSMTFRGSLRGRHRFDDKIIVSRSALMLASINGYTTIVDILLGHEADVNSLDKYKRTALMIASANGHVETVALLIKKGAFVNLQEIREWSALMLASVSGHVQVFELLLEHGADVNMETIEDVDIQLKTYKFVICEKSSVLMIASVNGSVEIIKLLLKYERLNSVNVFDIHQRSALMIASAEGYIEIVELLLKHGADVNAQDVIRRSALMIAIEKECARGSTKCISKEISSEEQQYKIVERLLEYGADANVRDHKGRSALMLASEVGYKTIVELLLEYGADANIRDHKRRSALMLASEVGYITIVELLLKHAADLDMRDIDGKSAFMLAITHEQFQTAYFLLKCGAGVKMQEVEGKVSLIMASRNGHTELVQLLLLSGADANYIVKKTEPCSRDIVERSALMAACENGHRKTAELLLEHGADVDLQNCDRRSALMLASMKGHTKIAELLLDNGANIDLQGNDGFSAFMLACKWFQADMAKLLVERGADVSIPKEEMSVEFIACESTEIVKLVLQLGANVNMRRGYDGSSALMIASESRYYKTVKLLLENGALVNMQNHDGKTALMMSIAHNTEIAKLLLKHGADIHDDALILASKEKDANLVKLLLDVGAKINVQGEDGWSALLYACWNGDDETGHTLLNGGADVDIKKKYGVSPLMIASIRGHNNMVGLLLEHKADIDLQDDNGRTALTIACENRRTKTAKLLLESGANMNLQENDGTSALMIASRNALNEIVKLLLKYGADVNMQSNQGLSALEIANQVGHAEVVKLLADHVHDTARLNVKTSTIQVTNSEQYFLWYGFGLNLYIPENALPSDVQQCTIQITTSIMGDHDRLPKDVHLMSAVYSIKCLPKCHFSKPVTLEIQHCAKRENVHKLCFIRSKANSNFQIIASNRNSQAFFAQHTSYGFIELETFCQLAVGQRGSDERDYCASVYRSRHVDGVRHHRIHFAILWDTDAHNKLFCEYCQRNEMVLELDHKVEFQADQIELDIPYPEGVNSENRVWKIIPLSPPIISKKDVDKFEGGKRIPSCLLEAKREKDEHADLEHSVKLNGAKEPYNAFTISISACHPAVHPHCDVRGAQPVGHQRIDQALSFTNVVRELSEEVSADWDDVGLFLKLSQGSLDTIKCNYPSNAKKCFREMIKLWFKQADPIPSWAAIIEAINILGQERLAQNLKDKFLK